MATQQNGTTPQPRNMTNNRLVGQKDQGISDKQAHERLSFILAAAIVRLHPVYDPVWWLTILARA